MPDLTTVTITLGTSVQYGENTKMRQDQNCVEHQTEWKCDGEQEQERASNKACMKEEQWTPVLMKTI